ncbi:Uma2 family endonuclease [Geobacillus sp. NFOSA3]|nr:Uma2 family endonuclease [Geobacillus sp. NFOSA3]
MKTKSKWSEGAVKTPEFPNHNYTYEDYLKWDGQWELIDGVPYSMAPSPSFTHQYIIGELYAALRDYFQQQGCIVVMAPFDVIFASNLDDKSVKNVVQPDISVICDRGKITEKGCIGAPDLIVEVLSPSTALKDRNEKYKLYQRFEVKEYWMVDPLHRTIEVYGWHNGVYEKREVFGEQDVLVSFLHPDLKICLKDVFQRL